MNKKRVKISIYNSHCTPSQVMQGNGDYILDNICISCETDEDIETGGYYLDAIFLIDDEGLWKHIQEESILKVQMDYGEEYFRISKIDSTSRDITVFARQETIYQTLHMWLTDVRPENRNGQSALSHMRDNSIGPKSINVFSDIPTISTAYYQNMNMYKALHDCDQSFGNRWGGEIQRRGYNLTINSRIGTHRGVQIRSKKNLTGFEANVDIDNVFTRIKPKGYDGITIDGFVDSPIISNYPFIKTTDKKYEDVKVATESNQEGYSTLEEAQAELIRLSELEFSQNHIDKVQAYYRVNFVQLEQTEEYKDYVQAERVFLGDSVDVYEETLDIDITVRAIRKRYDVLRQKVIEIELSNTYISQRTITTSDILAELNSIISKTENNNVSDIIQSMINSGIKDSYVIPRQNELLVADNKDINLANNIIRINKNGLAFSKTGYYGKYEYGFTIDGVINASLISTGILSAILIQNADGSLQIDLGSKQGIMTRQNGKNAIELSGTRLRFYDWDGEGENVGQIFSSRQNYDENMPGLTMGHSKESFSSVSYHQEGTTYKDYITFDKYKVVNTTNEPISIWTNVDLKGKEFWLKYGIDSIYTSIKDNFINKVKNAFIVADRDSEGHMRLNLTKSDFSLYDNNTSDSLRYCFISPSETFFANNGYKYFSNMPDKLMLYNTINNNDFYCKISPEETFFASNGQKFASFYPQGFSFWKGSDDIFYTTVADTIQSDRGMHINGDFTVNGNKNCVQTTANYGDRLYYSVEDCESYLTDRSMQLFTVEETSEGTYERVILLDNIYKESINIELGYTVEIIKQGWGDYRIKEQTKDYFIVESDRKDFTFKYIVTGKRKGYEEERNKELFKTVKSEFTVHNIDNDVQTEFWRLYSNVAVKGSDINAKAL